MLSEVFITLFVVIVVRIMGVLVVVCWKVITGANTTVEYGDKIIKIQVF